MKSDANSRDQRDQKKEINIDMNPMVDLAFLLLTFFMLTTTFSKPQAMEIVMPLKPKAGEERAEQPVKESRAVTLLLGDDDKVYWYQGITDPEVFETSFDDQGVRGLLLDKNEEIENVVILVKPLKESVYDNLVDILDELQISEVKRYALVEATPFDRTLLAEQGFIPPENEE
jgi:biopolymer transport protein ExbD